MDTKLSIALLSGLSLFLSVGAFAVSDDSSSDYLNWSYAMGDLAPADKRVNPTGQNLTVSKTENRECTVGCPGRPETDDVEPLTLTYEDEAAPVIEKMETFSDGDRFVAPSGSLRTFRDTAAQGRGFPISQRMPEEAPDIDAPMSPIVDTQYIQSPSKVQYPITRQYPISVQYPITVQRNMTVEQPVIMQQPVIVRRPVVMQQDITVQRQPAIIQQQPVIMQQQPTFVQQQPIMVQAPMQPVNPMMLPSFGYMPQPMGQPVMNPVQPMPQMIPYTSAQPMFQQPVLQPISVVPQQQYYIQGQVMAQPIYAQDPYNFAPQAQPSESASQPNSSNMTY